LRFKLLASAAALTMAFAGSAVAATPASASDAPGTLCMLTSDAWLYASVDTYGGSIVLRTVHAGRGFRWHNMGFNDAYGRNWYYGHRAEAPDQDGWVLGDHLRC